MVPSIGRQSLSRRAASALAALVAVVWAGGGHAQLAQNPLYLGASATPNVMYTIDESWSMAWRYMPDAITISTGSGPVTIYGNPWATGGNDSGDGNGYRWGLAFHPADPSTCRTVNCNGSTGTVNAFVARANAAGVATDLLSARLRSSAFNSIYYNPEVRYEPWYQSDGTKLPDADIHAAWLNPNNRSSSGAAAIAAGLAVDLHGLQTFTGSTRWCRSNPSTAANDTTVSNQTTPTCGNLTNESLAPAVYYEFDGTDLRNASSFRRVRIADLAAGAKRGAARTDCADDADTTAADYKGKLCTRDQEYQNFANWFTYNRTRMFLAIASTSRAFSEQGAGLRVGYARLHKGSATIDGASSPGSVERGVRTFAGTERDAFFTWLYSLAGSIEAGVDLYGAVGTHYFAGGTPLRQAMDDVGQYYSRSDNRGPWGRTPGTNDTSTHSYCRKCYNILMTDGNWTGSNGNTTGISDTARNASRQANVDNSAGPAITGFTPLGAPTSFSYSPAAPYSDSVSNTLADVAMYYWNRDLRTDLTNAIKPDTKNEAFWQHMVNFTVGLGVKGTLRYPDDFEALQAGTLQWPSSVNSGDPATVDDLWHAAVNSRGEYFSAGNPQEFASGLSLILTSVADRDEASSSSVAANSTRLDPGTTLIYQAKFNPQDWSGQLVAYSLNADGSPSSTEVWDTSTPGKIPSHASRNVFTAVGTQGTVTTTGLNFNAANFSSLSASQQGALRSGGTVVDGSNRINWLRGQSISGWRTRTHVLGDIVNSDLAFAGRIDDFGYRSLPGTEGSSYATFLSSGTAAGGKSDRLNMIYVGANDGMLHGFNADTGQEVFGYVPLGVYNNLAELTSTTYQHRYYVDGSPRVGDAYLGGAWKTILLGATGAGGKSVFALNVTNPSTVGASSLMWEYSGSGLGYTLSQPVAVRISRSSTPWAAMFGNGYDLTTGNVSLLVVDLSNGTLIRAIDTGVPVLSGGVKNALGSVVPIDVDNDRITDYVYGGDLLGNLWRFDVRSNSANSWSATRIFTAVDGAGTPQPITARPDVGRHPDGGVMIYFGTGKYFEIADATIPANPQIQSFYGIRDQFSNTAKTKAQLTQQQIIFEGVPTLASGSTARRVRGVSNNAAGTAGWYINLIPPSPASAQGERVVSSPLVRFGRVIFTSIIPDPDPCSSGGKSWLMEVDAISGGRLDTSVLDVNNDGKIDAGDYIELPDGSKIPASGVGSDELTKTPGIVGAGEVEYKYTSGSSGNIGVVRESSGADALGRQSWRQLQ